MSQRKSIGKVKKATSPGPSKIDVSPVTKVPPVVETGGSSSKPKGIPAFASTSGGYSGMSIDQQKNIAETLRNLGKKILKDNFGNDLSAFNISDVISKQNRNEAQVMKRLNRKLESELFETVSGPMKQARINEYHIALDEFKSSATSLFRNHKIPTASEMIQVLPQLSNMAEKLFKASSAWEKLKDIRAVNQSMTPSELLLNKFFEDLPTPVEVIVDRDIDYLEQSDTDYETDLIPDFPNKDSVDYSDRLKREQKLRRKMENFEICSRYPLLLVSDEKRATEKFPVVRKSTGQTFWVSAKEYDEIQICNRIACKFQLSQLRPKIDGSRVSAKFVNGRNTTELNMLRLALFKDLVTTHSGEERKPRSRRRIATRLADWNIETFQEYVKYQIEIRGYKDLPPSAEESKLALDELRRIYLDQDTGCAYKSKELTEIHTSDDRKVRKRQTKRVKEEIDSLGSRGEELGVPSLYQTVKKSMKLKVASPFGLLAMVLIVMGMFYILTTMFTGTDLGLKRGIPTQQKAQADDVVRNFQTALSNRTELFSTAEQQTITEMFDLIGIDTPFLNQSNPVGFDGYMTYFVQHLDQCNHTQLVDLMMDELANQITNYARNPEVDVKKLDLFAPPLIKNQIASILEKNKIKILPLYALSEQERENPSDIRGSRHELFFRTAVYKTKKLLAEAKTQELRNFLSSDDNQKRIFSRLLKMQNSLGVKSQVESLIRKEKEYLGDYNSARSRMESSLKIVELANQTSSSKQVKKLQPVEFWLSQCASAAMKDVPFEASTEFELIMQKCLLEQQTTVIRDIANDKNVRFIREILEGPVEDPSVPQKIWQFLSGVLRGDVMGSNTRGRSTSSQILFDVEGIATLFVQGIVTFFLSISKMLHMNLEWYEVQDYILAFLSTTGIAAASYGIYTWIRGTSLPLQFAAMAKVGTNSAILYLSTIALSYGGQVASLFILPIIATLPITGKASSLLLISYVVSNALNISQGEAGASLLLPTPPALGQAQAQGAAASNLLPTLLSFGSALGGITGVGGIVYAGYSAWNVMSALAQNNIKAVAGQQQAISEHGMMITSAFAYSSPAMRFTTELEEKFFPVLNQSELLRPTKEYPLGQVVATEKAAAEIRKRALIWGLVYMAVTSFGYFSLRFDNVARLSISDNYALDFTRGIPEYRNVTSPATEFKYFQFVQTLSANLPALEVFHSNEVLSLDAQSRIKLETDPLIKLIMSVEQNDYESALYLRTFTDPYQEPEVKRVVSLFTETVQVVTALDKGEVKIFEGVHTKSSWFFSDEYTVKTQEGEVVSNFKGKILETYKYELQLGAEYQVINQKQIGKQVYYLCTFPDSQPKWVKSSRFLDKANIIDNTATRVDELPFRIKVTQDFYDDLESSQRRTLEKGEEIDVIELGDKWYPLKPGSLSDIDSENGYVEKRVALVIDEPKETDASHQYARNNVEGALVLTTKKVHTDIMRVTHRFDTQDGKTIYRAVNDINGGGKVKSYLEKDLSFLPKLPFTIQFEQEYEGREAYQPNWLMKLLFDPVTAIPRIEKDEEARIIDIINGKFVMEFRGGISLDDVPELAYRVVSTETVSTRVVSKPGRPSRKQFLQ